MIQKAFLQLIESIQKHQRECLTAAVSLVVLLFGAHQVHLYQKNSQRAIADEYFNIIHATDYPKNDAKMSNYIQRNPSSSYSDLLRLQMAKNAFDNRENEQAETWLHETIKQSRNDKIRSLAAYRLAHVIKGTKTEQALKQTDKITSKSMRGLKSLLKAEIYSIMGDKAKAMIELDLIMSSQGSERDDRLLVELAHQQRRYLLQE